MQELDEKTKSKPFLNDAVQCFKLETKPGWITELQSKGSCQHLNEKLDH